MNQAFLGFYVTMFVVICMVMYAGVENTLNLFKYLELQIKYQFILVKMAIMRYRLKKSLEKSLRGFKKQ